MNGSWVVTFRQKSSRKLPSGKFSKKSVVGNKTFSTKKEAVVWALYNTRRSSKNFKVLKIAHSRTVKPLVPDTKQKYNQVPSCIKCNSTRLDYFNTKKGRLAARCAHCGWVLYSRK